MTTPANRKPRGGKHVPSTVPGHGPRDMTSDLARHRDGDGGRLSAAPGGPAPAQGRDADDQRGLDPAAGLRSAY